MSDKNILIIQGHPDPSEERFCDAIARSYHEGAEDGGHSATTLRLADLEIPCLRTYEEFYVQQPPSSMLPAIDALKHCNHLVVIFPLWLGGMPAFTRTFFEQLFRPGVAFDAPDSKFPKALMTGKSAHLIITMGMPSLAYRLYYGALNARGFSRGVLRFAGFKPIRRSYFGGIANCSDAKRLSYLEKAKAWGYRGA